MFWCVQFLLSSSMDKSVRLWHISMSECLRVFKVRASVVDLCFVTTLARAVHEPFWGGWVGSMTIS